MNVMGNNPAISTGIELRRHVVFTVTVALFALLYASGAEAVAITTGMNTIQTVIDTIAGPIGQAFAILMIMGLGVMALTGHISGRWAAGIILGIILIWGAAAIFVALQP